MEDPEFVSAEGLQVLARKSSPGAGELARLVHVMGSPDVSAALDQLVEGFKDRQVMDDRVGRILPWVEFSTSTTARTSHQPTPSCRSQRCAAN